MAIIEKDKLKGLIGPVVSREVLDQNVLQSKPKEYENTLDSQISACEGGIASTSGKALRSLFEPLDCRFDRMVHSRLGGALRMSLFYSKTALPGMRDLHDADLSKIKGFQLNRFSLLDKILQVRPSADLLPDGRLRLSVPAISADEDIKSPGNYSEIILRFLCLAVNFRHRQGRYLECKDFNIPRSAHLEPQEYFIECPVPEGSLIFLTASLHWMRKPELSSAHIMNTKEFSPAEILGVWKAGAGNSDADSFTFSNENISLPAYQWTELIHYQGNELLTKAAKILENMKPKVKSSAIEANGNPFPFQVSGTGGA